MRLTYHFFRIYKLDCKLMFYNLHTKEEIGRVIYIPECVFKNGRGRQVAITFCLEYFTRGVPLIGHVVSK